MAEVKAYVVGFLFSLDGSQVVLIRKNRPEWQVGMFNGPGGKIEPGEFTLDAMVREFKEETGITFEGWQPLVRLFRKDLYEVFFFTGRSDLLNLCQADTDEIIYICRVEDVGDRYLVPNLRWLIPLALDPNISRQQFIEVEDVAGN